MRSKFGCGLSAGRLVLTRVVTSSYVMVKSIVDCHVKPEDDRCTDWVQTNGNMEYLELLRVQKRQGYCHSD